MDRGNGWMGGRGGEGIYIMYLYVPTIMGVTCATLPTSSSACMMRLIRAVGNLVRISMPPREGSLGEEEAAAAAAEGALVFESGASSTMADAVEDDWGCFASDGGALVVGSGDML